LIAKAGDSPAFCFPAPAFLARGATPGPFPARHGIIRGCSLSQENAMPAAASGLSLYGIKAWNAMVNQAKPS
jgi:hypothetical protein